MHRAAAGLLAHWVCDGASVLATNVNWLTRRDPSFAELVRRVSIYTSGVEERDLNLADNWMDPPPLYDDSTWTAARLVAPVGSYSWTELHLRSLHLLIERIAPPLSRNEPSVVSNLFLPESNYFLRLFLLSFKL